MAYSVIIQEKVAAADVVSYNATAVCGSALENGNVVRFTAISGSSGYSEVFHSAQPTTGSLSGLWMAASPEVVNVTAADGTVYRGINQDPRNFINAANALVDVFKPQVGDIVLLSEDAFSGARSSNTHANSGADRFDLVWGTTQVGSSLSLKYLATDYITIGSGSAIGDTRLTAYRMLVLAN
jgi:predicted small secreted protein